MCVLPCAILLLLRPKWQRNRCKSALTHINYDITHGHLEVWTQSANTADANSDSRDDKARKAKEDI